MARILDNLKNNVDTTLHEEPDLAAPDMTAKSGATAASAGTPKLSMKSTFDADETVTVSPFDVEPIDVAVAEEEDPFGAVVAVEADPDHIDDPFAAGASEIHDAGAGRVELQSLLVSAREVVRDLEKALERARAHEAALRAKM